MSDRIHSILVVEDDAAARGHFAEAIRSSSRLRLLGAVGTCAEAYRQLEKAPPDILLTDLGLPDGHGIDLIRHVRVHHPTLQVLVISVFGDERTVIASVLAGANGYLLKDHTRDQLTDSILQLIEGGSPISPPIARYLLRVVQMQVPALAREETHGTDRPAAGDVEELSKRELEVLELLAKGFSSAETAHVLDISPHTVIAHCRSIHRKLAVNTRASAIYEARLRRLIE